MNVGLKSAPQYSTLLPGQAPAQFAPRIYRAPQRQVEARPAIDQSLMFAGNPDTVYRQIMEFYDKVGGFEHLILMGRSGFMTHEEAEKSIRLFAKEVLPRLREVAPVTPN